MTSVRGVGWVPLSHPGGHAAGAGVGAEVQPARPEPKVAPELPRCPLKDEVDPPGDAVVREAPLRGGPHQAVPHPPEVLKCHFVFGILEVVGELRRASLHFVLIVGPLLGDRPELRLGEVSTAFEVLSTARGCRYLGRLPESPGDDQGYTQASTYDEADDDDDRTKHGTDEVIYMQLIIHGAWCEREGSFVATANKIEAAFP